MANSPQEVLVECREHDVKAVALQVTDILGGWHQLTVPISRLTEESFEDGFAWTLHQLGEKRGELIDVLLLPQPRTAYIEPYAELPTMSLLCTMHDPLTREELPEDPRTIALKAEKFARESGVADEVVFSLGVEFFLFDARSRHGRSRRLRAGASGERLDEMGIERGPWGDDSSGTMLSEDFRNFVMQALLDCRVGVASHHQSRSDPLKSHLELSEANMVACADRLMITKHIVKRLAARAGKSATFMPLPQAGREPAGMLTQLSLLKQENSVLSGSGFAGLSDVGLHAIGGILKHASAIVALTNSTTNSYARLGAFPGKLPQIAYSQTDMQAALRVPSYQPGKSKCLEFRPPDATCNPYLAFSALLMAAIDGVQNKSHPGSPLGLDPYGPSEGPAAGYARVPASYEAALDALETDGDFLLRGDVLSAEVLNAWLGHKRMVDIQALRTQPHPHEVAAYYDV